MNDYGELLDSKTVRFERLLPGPIDKVWGYLVESEKRAQWLCGGETDSNVGGKIDMHFHNASLSSADDIARPEKYKDMPEKISFSGEVTRYEPPHALSHTWEFDGDASEVCYVLEEVGDKVRLILTHRRLGSSDDVLSVCGGWHAHLDILVDVLEQRKPRPFWKTQTECAAEYANRLGL